MQTTHIDFADKRNQSALAFGQCMPALKTSGECSSCQIHQATASEAVISFENSRVNINAKL